MSNEFQREYLVRLPLPLAQLYGRAHNAKDGRGRHDNCFYLCEALIKLAAAPLVAAYLQDIRRDSGRAEAVDRLLAQLALPSLGQWAGFLRELARHFGSRADAASHPLGHVWDQLNTKRQDLPGVLALFQRIKNGPEGKPAGDKSCSLLQLIDALVQYRNAVFGHGAGRVASFYEDEMGPLLFPAVNDILAEGTLDLLGPRESKLVYLVEVKTVEDNRVELGMRELVGLQSERMAPVVLDAGQAIGLLPDRVAVTWPGRKTPLPLDPLLVYREHELSEDVLFLNRDRNGKQVEYLSYCTGQTERDKSMAPTMARMLSEITGKEVTEERLEALKEKTLAETISVEAIAEPSQPAARTLGDYEILTELGRGGMGVVYLARQLSLGRLVALKMLPADMAGDDVALARFRREMRALGHCEHPNIVKVLSSGTMPDGQLYYAMEYVPGADLEQTWNELSRSNRKESAKTLGGTTWHRAIVTASGKAREKSRQKSSGGRPDQTVTATSSTTETTTPDSSAMEGVALPPLPELPSHEEDPGGYVRRVATMMRDAARAVQAVHDQNIVHRDIKPANLMLTPDGSRVVLMDFGLAKGGDAMSVTASHSAGFLGTLRYSAPEQLAAASLKVGPRADVRGLGITMWELLARDRLFGDAEDERQLTSWVLTRDVPRLRSVDSTIHPDLEAIVARATERSEDDRIQTAREMADYLDLYLQSKPIPIRTPSIFEMLRRWMYQNKTAAAASLAIVVMAVVTFIFVVVSRNAAIKAQAEAKSNFQLARKAVDEMLTKVGDESLKDVPQMEGFRLELLRKAREFYEDFTNKNPNDNELQKEVALAWRRIGDVYRLLEKQKEGIEAYDESIRRLAQLQVQDPNELLYQQELANSYNWKGVLLLDLDPDGAAEELNKAIDLQKPLVEKSDANADVKQELARSYYNLGLAHFKSGENKEAKEKYNYAIKLLNETLDSNPRNLDHCEHQLALCHNNLAMVLAREGLLEKARTEYELAVSKMENSRERYLENREYLSDLAKYTNNLAILLLHLGVQAKDDAKTKLLSDAAKTNRSAKEVLERLADAVPSVRNELCNTLQTGGTIAFNLGRAEEGMAQLSRALPMFERLVEQYPNIPEYKDRLGNTSYTLGVHYYRNKKYDDARKFVLLAIENHRGALAKNPNDSSYQKHLGSDYYLLARCFSKLELPEDEIQQHWKIQSESLPADQKTLLIKAREKAAAKMGKAAK